MSGDLSQVTGFNAYIPYLRSTSSMSTSGTVYGKIYSSDPTSKSYSTLISEVRNQYDGYFRWNTSDQSVHRGTLEIGIIGTGQTYYLALAASYTIQIGYNSTDGKNFAGTVTYTEISSIKTGKTEIKDLKNGKFTITATKGTNGTNNAVKNLTDLKWSYDNKNYDKDYTSGDEITLARSGNSNTRMVYAKSTTTATHGEDKPAYHELAVNQYYYPEKASITLDESSKKNGRLTVKQQWTFTWTCKPGATASNSAIKGYRIFLYDYKASSSTYTSINMKDKNGNSLCSVSSGTYYKMLTDTSITFDPEKSGIQPGQQIIFRVDAYSTDGVNTKLYTNSYSSAYTVENAGIVRVKVSNDWKEGQVYVKVNGNWKEAQAVYTKVSSNWKESN